MNSSESAEALVKMSLEGLEMALKITGSGAKNIAVLLYTISKDKKMTKGKTNLNNMLKSGSSLQIFSLKESELKKFHEESKKYGVLYTALVDKRHPDLDGLVDIMVKSEDAPKVNRIIERFKLSTIDLATIKSEVDKDKIEEMEKDAKSRGVEVKSYEERVADDLLLKPVQEESPEIVNPQIAKTVKDPQSEHSFESKNSSGVVVNEKKPSVRQALKDIKDDIKQEELSKTELEEKKKIKSKRTRNSLINGSKKKSNKRKER